jgi:hypothetical protein
VIVVNSSSAGPCRSATSFSAAAIASDSPSRTRKTGDVWPDLASAATSSSGSGGSARPLNASSNPAISSFR